MNVSTKNPTSIHFFYEMVNVNECELGRKYYKVVYRFIYKRQFILDVFSNAGSLCYIVDYVIYVFPDLFVLYLFRMCIFPRSFIVDKQPPQVLKTQTKFQASVRLVSCTCYEFCFQFSLHFIHFFHSY